MRKIFLIFCMGIFFVGCTFVTTKEKAKLVMEKHMNKKYGEEFFVKNISDFSKSGSSYSADVFLKKYVGTQRENDEYIEAEVRVDVKRESFFKNLDYIWDDYHRNIIREGANKFYGKKLEELFGEKYLPIFLIEPCHYGEYDFEKSVKSLLENSCDIKIHGGVYIFGTVENDKDMEMYREKIFQFIQFMKKTKTFEYVSLSFVIIDERSLAENFDREKFLKLYANNEENWITVRKKEIKKYKKPSLETIKNKLNNSIREQYLEDDGRKSSGENRLLVVYIDSTKAREAMKLYYNPELDYEQASDIYFYLKYY